MKVNKYGIAKIEQTKGVGLDIGYIGAFVGVATGLIVAAKVFDVISDVHHGSVGNIHNEIKQIRDSNTTQRKT